MKHVVGFSGGAASTVVAKIVHDIYPDNTVLLFCDTKTEPKDNYRFRNDAANFISLPVITLSDGRDIWQLFKDEHFLGNHRLTPCSEHLKRRLLDKWMRDNGPCIYYVGFTPDEYRRAQRLSARKAQAGIETRFPLIENKISKDDCLGMVKNCWGLKLPEMYEWFEHANCMPCVKGGLAYWGLVYMKYREAWERAVEAEKEHNAQILKIKAYGTLEAELNHCLDLAHEYLIKHQESLFEYPCECAA